MSAHAVLSPSAAERWLSCTPSARLEQQFADKGSPAAEEGTLAHCYGELLIRWKLKRISQALYEAETAKIQAHELYDHVMEDHAEAYAVFVLERYSEALAHTSDALLFLEQKLNLTDYVPDGFGTGDAVIIADRVMDIIDLKYGKGVLVEAGHNKQMMLYSLGALREFDFMYDIDTIQMTIFQPRIDNYSHFEMPVKDLRTWAREELIPRAADAFKGTGDLHAGKHCRFCKVAPVCKANADMNMEIARHEFAESHLLTDEAITDILGRADSFYKWLESVEAYALDQAVNHDKQWPGYKLVEGRGTRKYTDEGAIVQKLTGQGFHEDAISPRSLLGITALQKEIGKKTFDSLLTDYIIKPPGKLTLAPISDKRPSYNSAENAQKDFA